MRLPFYLIAVFILIGFSLERFGAQESGTSAVSSAHTQENVPPGMKKYFFGLLVKGPNRDQAEAEAEKLQEQHLAYIRQQFETGRYVLAGPFLDDGYIRGVLVINAGSKEEAEEIVSHDPAVRAGRMKVELHPALLP